MSDFFDSEIVRNEAQEMEMLQMKAMEITLSAPMSGSKEDQLEYINTVRSLIEKQQVFYMRLKLSDDLKANEMRQQIEAGARMMYGLWETESVDELMKNMLAKLDDFEQQIEAEG